MLVSAAWIAPAILGGIDVFVQGRIWGQPASASAILFVSGDWLLYALLTPGVFALARRWPLSRPHLSRNGAIQLLFSLLFCAAWAGAGTVLKALLQPTDLAQAGVARHFLSWLFVTLPFGVAVYIALVGTEHAIRYFIEVRERETQVARLSEQLTGARLTALQAQLNPHFLFNSLNTVTVLVRDGDTVAATRVIEQLSEVLRRTLRSTANEVALGDELELVRQYLAVEQARFSDRLRPEFDIAPDTLPAAVPSFALQLLVENAVRHGIARRSDAGRLIVTARRHSRMADEMLELTVEDDGAGIRDDAAPLPGHAIENTRERLQTLYGDRASLNVTAAPVQGTIARLRLPYRELLLEERNHEQR
jgi:hypothetical protein